MKTKFSNFCLAALIFFANITMFENQLLSQENNNLEILNLLDQKPKNNLSGNFVDNIEDSQNPFQDKLFLKERRDAVLKELSEKSKIEKFYSNRIDKNLIQNGYDIFIDNGLSASSKASIIGATQDNYLIGPGDTVIVNLQGGINDIVYLEVDKNGFLVSELIPPVLAMGKTFKNLKDEITKKLNDTLLETSVYITLDQLKKINIKVTGDVVFPNQYTLGPLSNLIDALTLAGGIKKSGSLRNIQILRNNKIHSIDLYNLIYSHGSAYKNPSQILQQGDIIVVPKIKSTFALSGEFLETGIFELGKNPIKILDVLNSIGGSIPSSQKNISIQRIDNKGKLNILSIKSLDEIIRNGDIVFLSSNIENLNDEIKIEFSSKLEDDETEYFSLQNVTFLSEIFSAESFSERDFRHSFILKNSSIKSSNKRYSLQNLQNVILGLSDYPLDSGDTIIILSNDDLDYFLSTEALNYMFNNNLEQKMKICDGYKIFQKYRLTRANKNKTALFSLLEEAYEERKNPKQDDLDRLVKQELDNEEYKRQKVLNNNLNKNEHCSKFPKIFKQNPDLLPFVLENLVLIRGSKGRSGLYLYNKFENIDSILFYSGREDENILISPDRTVIDVYNENIELFGSIKYPIQASLKLNPKLSDVLYDVNLLKENTYSLFATIERKNQSGAKSFLTFVPKNILTGSNDIILKAGDKIKIFSYEEIELFTNAFQEELVINSKKEETNSKKEENGFIEQNNIDKDIEQANKNKSLTNFENYEFIEDNKPITSTKNEEQFEKSNNTERIDYESFRIKNPKLYDLLKSKTVNISGRVTFPGVYPIGGKVDLQDVITLTGGLLPDADEENIDIISFIKDKTQNNFINPGDTIYVPSKYYAKSNITITGEIEQERSVGYKENIKISDIISNMNIFKNSSYLHFAYVKRSQKKDKNTVVIPFSPLSVSKGIQDFKLEKGDKINIYSKDQIDEILKTFDNSENIITPKLNSNLDSEDFFAGTALELIQSLTIQINGSIVKEGFLILGDKYTLEQIMKFSGGAKTLADVSKILITEPIIDEIGGIKLTKNTYDFKVNKNKLISPGSSIRIPFLNNELDLGTVSIAGEVQQPGKYIIKSDTTIFDILKEAGGLNKNAYLEGLIFSRLEEQNREKESIDRLRREIDKSLASALKSDGENQNLMTPETISALREISISSIDFKPVGRVVGNYADIDLLKNTSVIKGDKIIIPKRPTSISIVGEIMTPGSIIWEPEKSTRDYIKSAAGYTDLADKNKIFVIAPNGNAERFSSLWNNKKIKPGSTIVVPRKIELLSTLGKISAVTSVFYQLTLTLAGIDNIFND